MTTAEELTARAADVLIADGAFVLEHGARTGTPTVVLLDPSEDRATLVDRAPSARAWLTTASTGDQLVAAVEQVLAAAARDRAARTTGPREAASTAAAPVTSRAAPAAAAEARMRALAARGLTLAALGDVALVVFGVTCAAASLAFVWLALRP